jgi:AcrR family transcriptional regulator
MAERAGTRLSREERRAQLVELGVRLVSERSFDGVSTDDVAELAGISRSLLFHYFPTKREFQVAVAEAAATEMLAATEPDLALPPEERLRQSLAAFVDYVSSRREAFLSLVRGASGADEVLRGVFDRAHAVVASRILEGLGITGSPEPLLTVAVRGWIAFVEEAVVVWLVEGDATRDDLVGLLEQVLVQAVAAAWPPARALLPGAEGP